MCLFKTFEKFLIILVIDTKYATQKYALWRLEITWRFYVQKIEHRSKLLRTLALLQLFESVCVKFVFFNHFHSKKYKKKQI